MPLKPYSDIAQTPRAKLFQPLVLAMTPSFDAQLFLVLRCGGCEPNNHRLLWFAVEWPPDCSSESICRSICETDAAANSF